MCRLTFLCMCGSMASPSHYFSICSRTAQWYIKKPAVPSKKWLLNILNRCTLNWKLLIIYIFEMSIKPYLLAISCNFQYRISFPSLPLWGFFLPRGIPEVIWTLNIFYTFFLKRTYFQTCPISRLTAGTAPTEHYNFSIVIF